jgi:hypothetical protein
MLRLFLFHASCFPLHLMHCTFLISPHTYAFARSRFLWSRRFKREYGGPQASIVMDANIVVIKASLGALTNDSCLLIYNPCFMFFMIVQ